MIRQTGIVITVATIGWLNPWETTLAQQQAKSGYVTVNRFAEQSQQADGLPSETSPQQTPLSQPVVPLSSVTAADNETVSDSELPITDLPPTQSPAADNASSATPPTGSPARSASSPTWSSAVSSGTPLTTADAGYQASYRNQPLINRDPQCDDPLASCDAPNSLCSQLTQQLQGTMAPACDDACQSAERPIYFGRYEALIGLPHYSDTQPGATIVDGGLTRVEPFDYDLIYAQRVVAGFESTKGPGGQLQYFHLNADSNSLLVPQPSAGSTISGSYVVPGAGPFTTVTPEGGRLEANANQEISSFNVEAFKRIYWPISTLSGGLGLSYTNLDQDVRYAQFSSLNGTTASSTMAGRRSFEGVGPTFSLQYHRPIGHSHFAAIGGIHAALLFGSDDWEVLRDNARIYETHASRVMTNVNLSLGAEYIKPVNLCNNSHIFIRTTIEGQNWLNVGSFQSINSDFGFISGNLAIGLSY